MERLSAGATETGGQQHALIPLPHLSLSEELSLDEPGRISWSMMAEILGDDPRSAGHGDGIMGIAWTTRDAHRLLRAPAMAIEPCSIHFRSNW